MTTADLLMEPGAKKIYLALDHHCSEKLPGSMVPWAVEEVQRVVAQIAIDPADSYLQRHRVYTDDHPWFLVVVTTPSGVDFDIAISWTYSGDLPSILDISLEYRR